MFNIKFKNVLGFRLVKVKDEKQVILAPHPQIETLLMMPIKRRQFNYDVTDKFKKAVTAVLEKFTELRKQIFEDFGVEKELEFNDGKKSKTKYQLMPKPEKHEGAYIVKVAGVECEPQIIKENHYDITDFEGFNKAQEELFDVEVEFACYKLKMSRFDNEDLAWIDEAGIKRTVRLGDLELFIEDDTEQ